MSKQEFGTLMVDHHFELVGLARKAMRACEEILDSDDFRLKATVPGQLRELQLILETCRDHVIMNQDWASPGEASSKRKLLVYGQFMEMAVEKNKRYGLDHPELEDLARQAEESLREVESPHA